MNRERGGQSSALDRLRALREAHLNEIRQGVPLSQSQIPGMSEFAEQRRSHPKRANIFRALEPMTVAAKRGTKKTGLPNDVELTILK